MGFNRPSVHLPFFLTCLPYRKIQSQSGWFQQVTVTEPRSLLSMRNHPVHPVLWPTSHREQPTELIVPGLLKKLASPAIENNIRFIHGMALRMRPRWFEDLIWWISRFKICRIALFLLQYKISKNIGYNWWSSNNWFRVVCPFQRPCRSIVLDIIRGAYFDRQRWFVWLGTPGG